MEIVFDFIILLITLKSHRAEVEIKISGLKRSSISTIRSLNMSQPESDSPG